MTQQDQQLRGLVDDFVAELTVLIHQQALEAVRDALGETSPSRGPGRPRKTTTARGPGRPRKTSTRATGKRGRRSSEDVAALAETVLSHVRANPGQRLEEIGRDLSVPTKELKRPIANLMEAGKLRTKGQKRGTMYFADRKRSPAKSPAKPAKRKTAKRKTAKRKKAS